MLRNKGMSMADAMMMAKKKADCCRRCNIAGYIFLVIMVIVVTALNVFLCTWFTKDDSI